MFLLLLLKVYPVCLRGHLVSGKMHKGFAHAIKTLMCYDIETLMCYDIGFGLKFRFIQLREDYKSAKLASRLSSLWSGSS